MKPLELLKSAHAKIRSSENWTNEGSATNREGKLCNPWDKEAVRYSSNGALYYIVYHDVDDLPETDSNIKLIDQAERYLYEATPKERPIFMSYDAGHTHQEVMAVWAKAIGLARADEEKDNREHVLFVPIAVLAIVAALLLPTLLWLLIH